MGAENLSDVIESFKNGWQSFLLFFLIPFTVILLGPAAKPVSAMHQLKFNRIQHYEFSGALRGSSAVNLNCEVVHVFSSSLARKCLVISWKDLIARNVPALVQQGIVALIVTLPASSDNISVEEKTAWIETEQIMLKAEFQIPVYFVRDTDEVQQWLSAMRSFGEVRTETATEELLRQISGDYYYLSSAVSSSKQITDVKPAVFFGRLHADPSDQLPVVLLVAHLDAIGVAPSLAYGGNSDATGVAVLMEVIRILSHMVKNQKAQPKFDLSVLLTTGAKYNYYSTRKWLDDQSEGTESGLSSRLQFAACFDSVGTSYPPSIYVSRPPKEGSRLFRLFQVLNSTSVSLVGSTCPMVHKKINLADDELAFEHEQFSMAKIPAFTASSLSVSDLGVRKSILDSGSDVNVAALKNVVQLFVRTLGSQLYGLEQLENGEPFMSVSENHLASWIELLTKQPRALQFLNNDHPAVIAVKNFLAAHLLDFKVKPLTNEKGESEISFFGPMEVAVTVSRTKQPFFDLVVTGAIILYGAALFLAFQKVSVIALLQKLLAPYLIGSAVKVRAANKAHATKYQ